MKVGAFGSLVLLVAVAMTFTGTGYAQAVGANGTISGTVEDSSGAVIPGAAVEAVNIDSGATRATVSNSVGLFSLDEVPIGNYTLTGSAEGFGNTVISPIEVGIKARIDLSVVMNPGTVVQTVEVTGAALRLESQSSDIGQVVTNQSVKQLPTRLRNPIELVGLVPGVTNTFVQGTGGGYYGSAQDGKGGLEVWSTNNFSIAGGHRTNAVILVDGLDIRSDNGGGTSQQVIFTPDFIQEFKVQVSNYSAEYGQGAGVVNMVLKSGTNQFHGSVYDYLQNDNLNANLFFNNANGVAKGELKRNQYGYVVGGPIVKNKAWFITDNETLAQRGPRAEQGRVPTALEEAGNFSGVYGGAATEITIYNPFDTYTSGGKTLRRPFTNNTIPMSLKDASGYAGKLTPYYPEPNRPGGDLTTGGKPTNANNWVKNIGSKFDYDRTNFKLDLQPSNAHRIGWRFSRNFLGIPNIDLYGNIASPFVSGSTFQLRKEWQVNHTWTATPTTVVNTAFYYYWDDNTIQNPSAGFDPVQLGGPFADGKLANQANTYNSGTSFPSNNASGYVGLGSSVGFGGWNSRYRWAVGVSSIQGKHEIRYGMQIKPRYTNGEGWNDRRVSGVFDYTGGFTSGPDPLAPTALTGNGYADMWMGLIGGGRWTNEFSNHSMAEQYAFYFDDTWRVTDKLTLNLGLRYDWSMPGLELAGQNVKFDPHRVNPVGALSGPNTTGTVADTLGHNVMGAYVFAETADYPGSRMTPVDRTNWAPRLGFAYKANNKTVIRGGLAKLYWLTTYRQLFSPSTNPFSASTPINASDDGINPSISISNPFPSGLSAPVGKARGMLTDVGGGLSGGPGGQMNPYSWQWNFGIQRELPGNGLITIAYMGSMARRLPCPFFFCGAGLGESALSQGDALLESVSNPFYGLTDPNGQLNTALPLFGQETVQRRQLLTEWPQYGFGGSLYLPPVGRNSEYGLFTEEFPFKNSWHGMTLGYEKRYSDGLQAIVSLTMGKNLTTADSFEAGYLGPAVGSQNVRDWTKEKSLSAEDTSYRLVVSHVYDLPVGRGHKLGAGWNPIANAILGGWQISGIWTFQSGFPINVTDSGSNLNAGWGTPRPHQTSSSKMTKGSRGSKVSQWLAPGSFATPAAFTFGTAPRTLMDARSDGIKNFDISLIKQFRIAESVNVEMRAEMYNLFNRPQFGRPDGNVSSATFGRITSVVGPARYSQLALKFNF